MTRTICIYHAHCIDGFTAAWVVNRAMGPMVEMIPARYGDTPPDVTDAHVFIVDFSYPREALARMATQAASILVLDHHQTAQAALADLTLPNTTILFDMTRSGARLAWDWFYDPATPIPALVRYVEDRDLWRFALPNSRTINATIGLTDQTFEDWTDLCNLLENNIDHACDLGHVLLRQQRRYVEQGCDMTLRYMQIGGHRVPVANLPAYLASDAGHLLAEGNPFAATYFDTANGRKFSLRSTDAGQDVAQIAQTYGGGGHRNAAGFMAAAGWEGEA